MAITELRIAARLFTGKLHFIGKKYLYSGLG